MSLRFPTRNNRRNSTSVRDENPRLKILSVGLIISLLLAGISAKAVQLQILNRDQALDLARKQHNTLFTLLPRRGRILDTNHKVLTMNLETESIYVRPRKVTDAAGFINKASKFLGIPVSETRDMLASGKSFIWLKRLVDPKTVEMFKTAGIDGVGFVKEARRLHPNNHLAGQVLGFTDVDSRGIEGIEYYLNSTLAGKAGKIIVQRDGQGRKILSDPIDIEASSSGKDIILTLDSHIQYIVERELMSGIRKSRASGGMAVLMEPDTGAVLAMASYPFFDPNDKGSYPESSWRNLPIWSTFEPGSTMKIFLAAAALEEKKVLPTTKFNCMQGRRKVANAVINDSRPHGRLTVEEIIKVSSNVCSSLIAEGLGVQRFYEYLTDFGFGHKTGIDLPGESSGKLLNYKDWGPVELATMSFGQGVSVTALQMATALAAIANGGYVMKPYVVDRIVSPGGRELKKTRPEVVKRVLSYENARAATKMLVGVTSEGGTGTNAAVDGYLIAGKTGTAQIPDHKKGGYHQDRHLASFMGFAPAVDPAMALIIVVDDPKTSPYGGVVAAPIFKAITEKVLFYLGAAPSKTYAETKVMPNLKGMSARDILLWAEQEGMDVTMEGVGYAVEQDPAPGKRVRTGTDCVVRLEHKL